MQFRAEIISHMNNIPEDRWEKAFGKKEEKVAEIPGEDPFKRWWDDEIESAPVEQSNVRLPIRTVND